MFSPFQCAQGIAFLIRPIDNDETVGQSATAGQSKASTPADDANVSRLPDASSAKVDVIQSDFANRPPGDSSAATLSIQTRPRLTQALLMLTDVAALTAAGVAAVWLRRALGFALEPLKHVDLYPGLWPLLGLCIPVYALAGSYPGFMRHPGLGIGRELKRMTAATMTIFLLIAAMAFVTQGNYAYSRAIFLLAWGFTLIFVPMFRVVLRHVFAGRSWWGFPTLVLGWPGVKTERVIRVLRNEPELGLKAVAILQAIPDRPIGKTLPKAVHDVPVLGDTSRVAEWCGALKIKYAIVAMPRSSHGNLLDSSQPFDPHFPHLLFAPKQLGGGVGMLDLEMRQRLLLPGARFSKVALDLTLGILLSLLLLPFLFLVAAIIKLGSRGPVLYYHERVGHHGRLFKMWKFRSMVSNADQVLKDYLAAHPELKDEWEANHKLKDDPRITRFGRFIRKTSIDELPQLWNVIRGEMSLVGPRPIVQDEIQRYRRAFALYMNVRPGITGLWQVSGRSDRRYRERVFLDAFYVRNWTIWMDLFILIKTIKVVLGRRGSY